MPRIVDRGAERLRELAAGFERFSPAQQEIEQIDAGTLPGYAAQSPIARSYAQSVAAQGIKPMRRSSVQPNPDNIRQVQQILSESGRVGEPDNVYRARVDRGAERLRELASWFEGSSPAPQEIAQIDAGTLPGYAAQSPIARAYAQELAAQGIKPMRRVRLQPNPENVQKAQQELAEARRVGEPDDVYKARLLASPEASAVAKSEATFGNMPPYIAPKKKKDITEINRARAEREQRRAQAIAKIQERRAARTQPVQGQLAPGVGIGVPPPPDRRNEAIAEKIRSADTAGNMAYFNAVAGSARFDENVASNLREAAKYVSPSTFRLMVEDARQTGKPKQDRPSVNELTQFLTDDEYEQYSEATDYQVRERLLAMAHARRRRFYGQEGSFDGDPALEPARLGLEEQGQDDQGPIIVNRATGQRMKLSNGRWVPIQ